MISQNTSRNLSGGASRPATRTHHEVSGTPPSLRGMPLTATSVCDLELQDFEGHFSPRTFDRGAAYADGNRVLSFDWNEHERTLSARVAGSLAVYSTTAYFDDDSDRVAFVDSECNCPIGFACKHVVAAVLAAIAGPGTRISPGANARLPEEPSSPHAPASVSDPAASELPLRALVAARSRPATGNPLAIELRLMDSRYRDHGERRLMARVMRPGARGGWVNGSLDWRSLDTWTVRDGGFREDHLELLRELYAAYRLREPYSGYMYGYGSERSIALALSWSETRRTTVTSAVRSPLAFRRPRFPGSRTGSTSG